MVHLGRRFFREAFAAFFFFVSVMDEEERYEGLLPARVSEPGVFDE
jgi:hypothetical protein